ncbi:MAG: MarR family transcriptional regulator [Idiomarinaceae bacterium HL-53]|nr:MAG: MarR family transcriptional regulator [Idiomarinaceae bacterium HL-53]CUS47738.1 DNA-binding transcriptional regulator, MarR family [Idiomarinaceae bacterium HL-53]
MTKASENPHLVAQMAVEWQRERPELPVDDAALIGMLIGVTQRIERVGQVALKEYELGTTEHAVLACLRRKGQPYQAIANDILTEIIITSGALTTCVDRLIKRGLVTRKADRDDKRKRWIQLTPEGAHLINQVTEERFQLASELLSGFSEKNRVKLKKLIFKFHETLQAYE